MRVGIAVEIGVVSSNATLENFGRATDACGDRGRDCEATSSALSTELFTVLYRGGRHQRGHDRHRGLSAGIW